MAEIGDAALDEKRFEVLYRDHRERVFSWARRMVANRDEAEDLAHETFARAWRGFARFREEAAFSTWLYRILLNLVQDVRRPASVELEPERHVARVAAPESRVERRFIGARIDEALGRLSPMQRQVFVLRELEEMKHDAIAARLGVAASTVRVHYFQALKRLREELHDLA